MKKDRLIALFAHFAANQEADVELFDTAGESCGWYSMSEIASNDLDYFGDWKPAPPKPRTWSGRVIVDKWRHALLPDDLPEWITRNEVDLTITEVLK